jgi:hypothetical protein
LIDRKRHELQYSCLQIENDLFRNTINVHDIPTSYGRSRETWIVVACFRDWLGEAITRLRDSTNENWAEHLRQMRKGDDAYLPYNELFTSLKGSSGKPDHSAWAEVREDLQMLKQYAQECVEPLCKNELMLDVEAAKIGYLTCTTVKEEEMPWAFEESW